MFSNMGCSREKIQPTVLGNIIMKVWRPFLYSQLMRSKLFGSWFFGHSNCFYHKCKKAIKVIVFIFRHQHRTHFSKSPAGFKTKKNRIIMQMSNSFSISDSRSLSSGSIFLYYLRWVMLYVITEVSAFLWWPL